MTSLLLATLVSPPAAAEEGAAGSKRPFDVPAGAAARTLSIFSTQADVQLLFPTELVAGVRTHAVRGEQIPIEALREMVRGTTLTVIHDAGTGALGLTRRASDLDVGAGGGSRLPDAGRRPGPTRISTTNQPPRKSMQRRSPLSFILGLFAAAVAVPEASAQSPELGAISGRVFNESTGAYLEGAEVRLEGAATPVVTDREGAYVLPAGPGVANVSVSYPGLDVKTFTVDVPRGGQVRQDVGLTAAIYRLESFVVEGDREGTALAASRQRAIFNATNIAATDAFGTQTEDNVGSFLQRLPGLTAEFSGASVREVQVRGIDAELNTVAMDGVQLANTNSSGTNRFFDFLQASISMVESIEVTKAPTPDMPANSIGGNINMVTRSIFTRRNPRMFTYSVGVMHSLGRIGGEAEASKRWYEEPIDNITPVFRFGYTDVVGSKRNLGLSLNYSRQTSFGGSRSASNFYASSLDRSAYLYRTNMYISAAQGPHTRQNINGKLEFKASETTLFTFTAAHNFYLEINDTRTHNFQTGNAAARFAPGYSDRYSEILPHTSSVASISVGSYDNVSHNYRFGATGEHKRDQFVLDYSATLSLSNGYHDYAPFERSYSKGAPKASLTIGGLTNIGFILDRRQNESWPTITQTAGDDAYDLASYSTMVMTQNHRIANAEIREARINARRNFALPVPAFVKAGLQYQDSTRDREFNYHRYNFVGPGGLTQFADRSSWVNEWVEGRRQGPWVDTLQVAQHKEDNPDQWPEDLAYKFTQRLQNDMNFREEIAAAYVMGQARLQNLGILGGLRVEETTVEGNGPLYQLTAEERARRATWVGALTPEEMERRALAEWGQRARAAGKYRKVFPSLHFKYEHPRGLVFRASYSTSIGRPGLTSVIPNTTVNDDAQTVSASNPDLQPQYSDSFDLGVEYYFKSAGVLSASVFLKEVSDFIFSDSSQIIGSGPDNGFDGLYEGYRLTTSANGGSARYRGFELSYQQQLNFLPGFLRGIGLNANYTQLETKGDYGGAAATTQVVGFRPKSANLSLNYKLDRFDFRVQTNWVDDYLVGLSSNPALLRYESARATTNLKVSYALNGRTSLYFNMDNVFDEPLNRSYYYYSDRINQTRNSWRYMSLGVQGRF